MKTASLALVALCLLLSAAPIRAENNAKTSEWVTVTSEAAGTKLSAKDEALQTALRKAVEQVCGVFLNSQSKTDNFKLVYDKVFADAVGYVERHKDAEYWIQDGNTHCKVTALVSKRKFEDKWAAIAHTVSQEGNPRIIIAIVEYVQPKGAAKQEEGSGIVLGKIEDFFIEKGIEIVDKQTADEVSKRDKMLAAIKDDAAELAALGARFKADVIVVGTATAKFGKTLKVSDIDMYQYVASLRVRAIRTDSAKVIASKSFGPTTANSLQAVGGEDKALAELGNQAAPKLLEAMVQAWRKQVHVTRNVRLNVSGMDYAAWKEFNAEVKEDIRGVQALRLREITESVANIDVEYAYGITTLADRLTELKKVKLEITEITANRIKLKMVK